MAIAAPDNLREALSRQERYQRELDKLIRQVDRLEERAVKRAFALLTQARRQIVDRLSQVPEDSFLAGYLPQLQAEVEAAMGRYVDRYGAYLADQAQVFWDLGVSALDRPITAAGGGSVVSQLPSLEPRYVDILQGFRANLITDISDHAITQITTQLQLGVLGGSSPFQIMQGVSAILRTQPDPAGVFHGVAARAETITRTELNRTFNLATESRQEQFNHRVQQLFPEVEPKKRWVATKDTRTRPSHRRMDGQTVPISDDFVLLGADGQTYKAKQPHDARLPAAESSNCRCRSVVSVESIMSILEAT